MPRVSYREQLQKVREDAIVQAVNRLLATKGYDLMTVDEVAAEAGIAKASLYKHFISKEELAAAAMVGVLDRAAAQVDALHQAAPQRPAVEQLQEVVRWTLHVQLAGEMPSLPAQNSRLSEHLRGHKVYMDRLLALSDRLGMWIEQAQADGALDRSLPGEVILYTLFARACDPVLAVLKASGQYADEQIVEWLVKTTFAGLAGETEAKASAKRRGAKKTVASSHI
jgi:AcrR family transcriptional regulator